MDAQFNVQHTCFVLDILGHCALFMGEIFDRYVFRSLHRVLLNVGMYWLNIEYLFKVFFYTMNLYTVDPINIWFFMLLTLRANKNDSKP